MDLGTRLITVARLAALSFVVTVGCGSSAGVPAATPSLGSDGVEAPSRPACPPDVPDCLTWDTFAGAAGAISRSSSGQVWDTWGLSCPECHPVFETDGSHATMASASDKNSIWLATIDTGRATGITLSADIRMSPTPLRANVGLVALFADRMNHLVCKIEVSEGHPDGLLAIGDERQGATTSLLAERDDVGFVVGETYHLRLNVPSSLGSSPVTCRASGPGIRPTMVAYRLNAESIAAYGSGTGQGLRIKISDDEDDGGSSWDDFGVTPKAS